MTVMLSLAEDPYTARAEAMDDEYIEAWRGMTPEMRERLRKAGVVGPELNRYDSKQGPKDVSEFVELAAPAPEVSQHQKFADMLAEQFGVPPSTAQRLVPFLLKTIEQEAERRKAEQLGRVVGLLLAQFNTKVSVMGLAIAMEFKELKRMGILSMRDAAPRVDCSPAYLSQQANMWCDALDLPRPKKLMKSAEARKTYQMERKNNHWRHRVCE